MLAQRGQGKRGGEPDGRAKREIIEREGRSLQELKVTSNQERLVYEEAREERIKQQKNAKRGTSVGLKG